MEETTYKGVKSLQLENDNIKATFLPDYGSKLASMIDKETGEELLFQTDEQELRIPSYGADFSKYDSSGFDEVFPSIDSCIDPLTGKAIPDHGEVWALPWKYEVENKSITFEVESPTFPYIMRKKVWLEGNRLCFDYEVENKSNEPFPFIWTPHALLRCSEQTEIIVPNELNEVMTVEHGTEHLGEWGTIHNYPVTTSLRTGQNLDLSKVEPISAKNCEKYYFTKRLTKGICGIYQHDTKRSITYHYPVNKIPYLAVWKTQGGYRGDYNIALEPCTGVYDDLYVAYKLKKVSMIQPRSKFTWWFHMEVGGDKNVPRR